MGKIDAAVGRIDDGCREKVCFPFLRTTGIERPRLFITILFMTSSVLVLVAFILGCATASTLDSSGAHVGALSFAAVISSLMCLALTGVGFAVLRKYKTPLSIGAYVGSIFVMANFCLILCAIFGNLADVTDDDSVDAPYEAFATFQFFLFTVYAVFGVTLSVFRNSLLDSGPSYDDRMESQDRQNHETSPHGNNESAVVQAAPEPYGEYGGEEPNYT